MITFKPCVTYRRRDGTYAVRIRVTFRRQSRYLPTTNTAYPEQLTRSGKIKDGYLLAAAERIVRQMRDVAAELSPFALEGKGVDWVVAWLRARLAADTFHLDIFAFAGEIIAGKSPGTAEAYRSTLHVFARWLGREHLDVNDVTGSLLRSFAGSLPQGTAARHLGKLATIYNAAKEHYNVDERLLIPGDPFRGISLKVPAAQGQRPLSQEVMQLIILDRPADPRQAEALAAFVVSFGTMGANLADMYAAPAFKGDVWHYERSKTRDRRADRARMEVAIDSRLAYHLVLLEGRGPWWLPALHRCGSFKAISSATNRALRSWALAHGLTPFTFYAARHTWATMARSLGVEKATVDEGLAHVGDFRITDIYAERNWAQINGANRRVLDAFSWGAGEP